MRLDAKPSRLLTLAALAALTGFGCKPADPGSDGQGGTGGKATGGTGGKASGGSSGSSQGGSGGTGSGSMGGTGGGPAGGTGGSSPGTGGGRGGAGGTPGTGGAGTGGAAGGAGGGGGSPADTSPADTGAGETPAASGWAGVPGIEDLSTVKRSLGCGMDPGQALGSWVRSTVTITPKPVRGQGNRSYFIKLPANYDRMKAYRLVFVVPGCNGSGDRMFDFTEAAGTDGVIQIGMNPEPGAASYPGCFDDFNTDSVEPKYFETLLEIARKKLCFDEHRVYFTGHSSGSFVSNMMGCIYGSTKVRGIAPSSGGLADNSEKPNQAPPCVDRPVAGIFSHNDDDGIAGPGNLVTWTHKAINRALKVNGCQGTVMTSPKMAYPGHPNCEIFTSCPKEFPVVFCHPKTGGHEGNKELVPARAWQFWKSLP